MGPRQRANRKIIAASREAFIRRLEAEYARWEFFRGTEQEKACDEEQRWKNFEAATQILDLDVHTWWEISRKKAEKKFRKLSLFAHPDKPSGDRKKFDKLTSAYDIVKLGIAEWIDNLREGPDVYRSEGATAPQRQASSNSQRALEDDRPSMRRLFRSAQAERERSILRAAECRTIASLPRVGKKGAAIFISRPEDFFGRGTSGKMEDLGRGSPLRSAKRGKEVCPSLIEAEADVGQVDNSGMSPVHAAAHATPEPGEHVVVSAEGKALLLVASEQGESEDDHKTPLYDTDQVENEIPKLPEEMLGEDVGLEMEKVRNSSADKVCA